MFVGLLAHYPKKRVYNIGFTATVWTDNTSDGMIKMNDGFVLEGFKTLYFQPLNAHSPRSPLKNPTEYTGNLASVQKKARRVFSVTERDLFYRRSKHNLASRLVVSRSSIKLASKVWSYRQPVKNFIGSRASYISILCPYTNSEF